MRFALLSLLLAAQGFAYAHALDHDGAAETSECTVCVAGQALGAAVTVSHEPPAAVRAFQPSTAVAADSHTPPTVACFGARAPPHRS